MKKCRGMLAFLFAGVMLVSVSCGKADPGQGEEKETFEEVMSEANETADASEYAIVLKKEPFYYHYQSIEQTWEKDYTSEEWKDGKCLNVYVMIFDMEGQEIPVIEDELNHRLHMAGYDFYVHFWGPTFEEMHGEDGLGGQSSDELVMHRNSQGTLMDMWVTEDYVSAVQNGEVLELTDFLQSEAGSSLYADFDACVWEQMMVDGERIYGIPMEPIATGRCVYGYTPQLMEQLSIDMSSFSGDPGEYENLFPALLQKGVLPLDMERMEDRLMLSMLGLENYGGIIAVRHDGDKWEAVDLWMVEEAMAFYNRLGEWREKGFLDYTSDLLKELKDAGMAIEDETGSSRYPYILFRLDERAGNTLFYPINSASEDDGTAPSKYYVPNQPAYISAKGNRSGGAAVISAETAYPKECKEFLKILFLDPEIRLLLYKGIEGEHYIWQDGALMNGSAYGFPIGLGFSRDLRFWPAGEWGARYAEEIRDMNRNVSIGLGATMPYDLSETPELSDKEAACKQIIEENRAVFLGYYGNETAKRLEEVHEQLVEAGYLELIEAVNAKRVNE